MTRRPAPCGTRGGYQRHIRLKTPPCEACKKASAAWMKKYRDDNPHEYEQTLKTNAARTRALWRLATQHRDEFTAYVREEMEIH